MYSSNGLESMDDDSDNQWDLFYVIMNLVKVMPLFSHFRVYVNYDVYNPPIFQDILGSCGFPYTSHPPVLLTTSHSLWSAPSLNSDVRQFYGFIRPLHSICEEWMDVLFCLQSAHLVQAADFLRRVDDLPAAGARRVHPQNLLWLHQQLKSACYMEI